MDELSTLLGLSRRKALRFALAGAGTVLLAACSSGNQTGSANPVATPPPAAATANPGARTTSAPAAAQPVVVSSTATTQTAQPKSGGKLRFAMAVDLDAGVEPARLGAAYVPSLFMVFDTLTAYDDKRQPQPLLAESWDFSSDKTSIKLNLRKGVTFHSGREFTSDDVKYNLLRVRDPKVGSGQLVGMSNWFTVDTPDKYTVVLTADRPRPTVFDMFEYFNITDRDIEDGPNSKTQTGGTGPFKFVEWAQGDHLSFSKNQQYWNSGHPYLDEIQIAIAKDQQAMVVQLESGALDGVINPALTDGVRLQKDSSYQTIYCEQNGQIYHMTLNTKQPPLDNKMVRQALNYAIDRQRFATSALFGTAAPIDLPWGPGSPAYDQSKNGFYTFDLDKAKQLLSTAGVTNLELDYNYNQITSELAALAQIYQADLAKVGVKLNLNGLDNTTYLARSNAHQYSFSAGNTYFGQMEPATLLQLAGAFRPTANSAQFQSDAYTQFGDAVQTGPDPAKRQQFIGQLNDLILDESFDIPIAPQPWFIVAKSSLHGIGWRVNQAPTFDAMWLE